MMRDTGLFNLRVAYVINQYPKLSHSFIRREIQAVERQGVAVTRIALRGWDEAPVDSRDAVERDKTHYVLRAGVGALLFAVFHALLAMPRRFGAALALALRMGWRAERPWPLHLAYLAEACYLLGWLKDCRVQHLHAHFGTNSAEVAMLAHMLSGIPYSITVHGSEEFDKPQFIGLPEKIARAAFVVGVSSYCRSQIYRWTRSSEWPKVHLVRCGLEKDYFLSASPPELPRRFVCVGRFCEQKAQLMLVEAAALLLAKGVDFEIVLAGDGEMRGDIEAAIARHGVERQVRITGAIPGERVRAEILAARALVIPSFAEGLPVVAIEAMALGRPVLATRITGIPELVVHGETGWLFPAGSVDDLAAAMLACLNTSPDIMAHMGEIGRRHALACHDVDQEAARLASLFNDAVLAHGGARLTV